MKVLEQMIEGIMFRSRWLLAPMYIGLVGGLILMFVKFAQEFRSEEHTSELQSH